MCPQRQVSYLCGSLGARERERGEREEREREIIREREREREREERLSGNNVDIFAKRWGVYNASRHHVF